MGAVDKAYRFETEKGNASLADLFQGRSQLLVYHFMFGPEYTAGCATCSTIADGFNAFAIHLANHDVMLVGGVARAAREAAGVQAPDEVDLPLGVLARRGLQLRLQRFVDRAATARGTVEYNYRREPAWPSKARAAAKSPIKHNSSALDPAATGLSPTMRA